MEHDFATHNEFEAEVAGRFGILPNFFRSAEAAPELIRELWGFAKAGYLDNPMPSVFKERLFVWLSRFCPMRYCIVRHVGFLLAHSSGRGRGDNESYKQRFHTLLRDLGCIFTWPKFDHAIALLAELQPKPGRAVLAQGPG